MKHTTMMMKLTIIALLSIAPCAGFGTFSASSSGGACIDEPAHVIAEQTATMGEWYAQYTSCDAIAQVGGCVRSAIAQAACCATCAVALPARMTYSDDPPPVKEGGACNTPGRYRKDTDCEEGALCRARPRSCAACVRGKCTSVRESLTYNPICESTTPLRLPPPPGHRLHARCLVPDKIKADVECTSADEWLGSFSTLEKCAAACLAKDGCEYFIYGKANGVQGNKAGACYWEKTSRSPGRRLQNSEMTQEVTNSHCSSGWEDDSYDFFKFPN